MKLSHFSSAYREKPPSEHEFFFSLLFFLLFATFLSSPPKLALHSLKKKVFLHINAGAFILTLLSILDIFSHVSVRLRWDDQKQFNFHRMDTEVGEEGESNTICERAASRRCCDGLLMNLIVVIIFFLLNCMYFVYGRFLTRNSIHFRLNNSLSRPSKKSVYYPLLGMKKLKNFSSLLAEAKQQLWESL